MTSIIYLQLLIKMYEAKMTGKDLSEKCNIPYTTLLRKLNGKSPLFLEEAKKIKQALGCEMPLETLFEVKERKAK